LSRLDEVGGPLFAKQQPPLHHLRQQRRFRTFEVGAIAVADLDQPDQRQGGDGLTHGRASDTKRFGQLPFRWNAGPGFETAREEIVDQAAGNLRDQRLAPDWLDIGQEAAHGVASGGWSRS
jgi:hypothetical protein